MSLQCNVLVKPYLEITWKGKYNIGLFLEEADIEEYKVYLKQIINFHLSKVVFFESHIAKHSFC